FAVILYGAPTLGLQHAETKVKDWENDDDPVSVAGDNDEVDQSPTFTNTTD
ncbi:hypothetical protein Tco_0291078, partial [Tanacetum coccineum]